MTKDYLISFCNEGLEAVVPITDIEHNTVMNLLADQPVPQSVSSIYRMLELRARYNTHRHYEIYAITANDGIDEHVITDMFTDAPQEAADAVRRIGKKLYSDRANKTAVIV